jgi:hypothetical protein
LKGRVKILPPLFKGEVKILPPPSKREVRRGMGVATPKRGMTSFAGMTIFAVPNASVDIFLNIFPPMII